MKQRQFVMGLIIKPHFILKFRYVRVPPNNVQGERLATPHIIYASRTHSQLTQVMYMYHRTMYKVLRIWTPKLNNYNCPGERLATPHIIYASRTHSQLTQVMCMYHRTMYKVLRIWTPKLNNYNCPGERLATPHIIYASLTHSQLTQVMYMYHRTMYKVLRIWTPKLNNYNCPGERLATPHIIYASRTHSQLTQVMKELKRSGYSHVKAAILGSRDQLCLHPDLSQEQGFMKVTMCRAKVRERTCHFYNNFDTNKMDKGFAPPEVVDIEDLVKFGNKRQCCPYYLARELTTSADITFMPYNYLLNPQTRQQQRLDLNVTSEPPPTAGQAGCLQGQDRSAVTHLSSSHTRRSAGKETVTALLTRKGLYSVVSLLVVHNAVVILDEAHNVEKMCEESASVHFSSTDIALCINKYNAVVILDEAHNVEKMCEESASVHFSSTDIALCINKYNAVVILDEAHNVEKMCEESASVHFSSTDIALCINEVTQAMKKFSDNLNQESDGDTEMDFKMEDLCLLKTMFLALEKAVDEIELDTVKEEGPNKGKKAGRTFPGSYIFGLLGKAEIQGENVPVIDQALTGLAQFLSTTSDSPLASKGNMLIQGENVPVIDQALTGLAQFLSTTSDSPLASKGNMLIQGENVPVIDQALTGLAQFLSTTSDSPLASKGNMLIQGENVPVIDQALTGLAQFLSTTSDSPLASKGNMLIQGENVPVIDQALTGLAQFLSTTSDSPLASKGNMLVRFNEFLKVVYASCGPQGVKNNSDLFYKVYIEPEVPKKAKPDSWSSSKTTLNSNAKVINFWCFSPGFAMRSLLKQGVHCIVLTSGTLSPLHATISELGIPIPVQLENPHIIEPSQISVNVLNKGPTGEKLISTFANRENPKYLGDLGRMLTNFCRVVPDGVLMFFPSYPLMEKTINLWQQEGFWSQIIALKPLFVEPQYRDRLADVMKEYNSALEAEDSRGAVFLAVLRGKVSEGMDFADARCRAVIITGLPYPPFKDPRIILKREYVDNLRKTDPKALSGNEWYQLEATRAVNQAVGRVIRHGSDFGAIMLCDCRFESSNITNSLSAWVRPHINKCQEFGLAYGRVSKFFKSMGIAPQTRPIQSGASFDSVEGKVRIKEKAEQPRKENLSQNSMQQFLEKVLQTQPKTKTSAQPSPSGLFDAIDVSTSQSESRKKDILRKCFNQPKEEPTQPQVLPVAKKRKLQIVPLKFESSEPSSSEAERSKTSMEYIREVKSRISDDNFLQLKNAVKAYAHPQQSNYNNTILCLRKVFPDSKTKDLFIGW
ncbi:Regulator of telomere elongation helicase 1 [Homalodisca vitripennis]|nr:Regulator of telomere elongation helicase 1 [Homalodisca vitripennis]